MRTKKEKRNNSQVREIWRKLKMNKVAMVSLVVIVLILLVAIVGAWMC